MIEKINRYPFVTAGIVQIAAFPFISDRLSGNIVSMLLTVSIWLWAIEVNENKSKPSLPKRKGVWINIPKPKGDPVILRIQVSEIDKNPVFEGLVVGDARFAKYMESLVMTNNEILKINNVNGENIE